MQGIQGQINVPVTMVATAASADPVDILNALADQLAASIRVCVEAGQITEAQARQIRARLA